MTLAELQRVAFLQRVLRGMDELHVVDMFEPGLRLSQPTADQWDSWRKWQERPSLRWME